MFIFYNTMKHFVASLAFVLCVLGAHAAEPQIGKSIGRWTGFGLESMKANKAAGLDYIEITMNNVIGKDPQGAPQRAEILMGEIQQAGLKVWSVHMPYSRTLDISVLDDVKRGENVRYMKDMMRVAGTFRPQFIVLHPSSEPISLEEREQRLANSHAAIGELAVVAKEIGATLCVENLPRTCLGQNGEEMMRLIEGYDDVGLCFDTNHLLYQSHEYFLKTIDKGRIKTVHLSDYDFLDERHLIPGQGLIDNKAVWAGIKENGYDGIMMFECYGEPQELFAARDILLGNVPQPDNSRIDSLAFANATWEITDLGQGAKAMYAQIPMFYSTQSISVVKYPLKRYKTEILHRPAERAGIPSEIGKETGAAFALNAAFFDMKELTPTVYFRKGGEQLGYINPKGLYRIDGMMGFKDRRGRKAVIDFASDTTEYGAVTKGWHTALASGPMLVLDGEIVVPHPKPGSDMKRHPRAVYGTDDNGYAYLVVIDGRFKKQADGASIYETAYICHMLGMTDAINLDGGGSATLWTEKTGVINHPSDNKKFDHEGERVVPNLIVVY